MKRKCIGFRRYTCVDGSCTSNWRSCRSKDSANKCTSSQYPYYCPTINICTTNDKDCLRDCGTLNYVFRYTVTCVGYEQQCASAWSDCPRACLRHRCNDGRCMDSEWECDPFCATWRCKNGQCLNYVTDHCDGVAQCSDRSDENDCSRPVVPPESGGLSPGIWIGVAMLGIIFFLIMLCCCLCCRYRQQRHRHSQARPTVVVSGSRPPTALPTPRPANYSEPYERRDNWQSRPLSAGLRAYTREPNGPPRDPSAPPEYVPPSPAYLAMLQPTSPSVDEAPPSYDDVIHEGYKTTT